MHFQQLLNNYPMATKQLDGWGLLRPAMYAKHVMPTHTPHTRGRKLHANRRRTVSESGTEATKEPLFPSSRKHTDPSPSQVAKREHKYSESVGDSDDMSDEARKVAKLEKNRQSARECRKRKKEYIGDLEAKLECIMAENMSLKASVAEAQQHNQELKKTVEELKAKHGFSECNGTEDAEVT